MHTCVPFHPIKQFSESLFHEDSVDTVNSIPVLSSLFLGQPDVTLHPDQNQVRRGTNDCTDCSGKPGKQEACGEAQSFTLGVNQSLKNLD